MRVTVDREGVTVVLPGRAPEHRAHDAVERLDSWIRRQLAEQEVSSAAVNARGWTLPWLDDTLAIVPEAGRKVAHRDGNRLLVPEGDFRGAVERLLRRAARAEVAERLDRVTAETGHSWNSLRIGDMKTRWASCRAGGAFSFSWRLMLAPDRVLETVVWHEVCHLDVPDHSAAFWDLLDSRRPGHRDDVAWLTEHGPELTIQPMPEAGAPWA
ncbi:MAG: SprT family zinc-dependent metalloprotease [Actinomycetes bacterium]